MNVKCTWISQLPTLSRKAHSSPVCGESSSQDPSCEVLEESTVCGCAVLCLSSELSQSSVTGQVSGVHPLAWAIHALFFFFACFLFSFPFFLFSLYVGFP